MDTDHSAKLPCGHNPRKWVFMRMNTPAIEGTFQGNKERMFSSLPMLITIADNHVKMRCYMAHRPCRKTYKIGPLISHNIFSNMKVHNTLLIVWQKQYMQFTRNIFCPNTLSAKSSFITRQIFPTWPKLLGILCTSHLPRFVKMHKINMTLITEQKLTTTKLRHNMCLFPTIERQYAFLCLSETNSRVFCVLQAHFFLLKKSDTQITRHTLMSRL